MFIALLLEIESANLFRVRAYRNAARTVQSLGEDVSVLVGRSEDMNKLSGKGKGKALAEKMEEIVATGRCQNLEKLRKQSVFGALGSGASGSSIISARLRVASGTISQFSCGLNRSMRHLISNTREEDVENEAATEDLLHRRTENIDVGTVTVFQI